jgi:hypothetical protein
MKAWNVDWPVALEYLQNGGIVSRFASTWKNTQMRIVSDNLFQCRIYIEGILEDCTPHWTEWENTDRQTYPANIEALDWILIGVTS